MYSVLSTWVNKNILIGAAIIGVAGGIIALLYYAVLNFLLKMVWQVGYGSSFLTIFDLRGHHWGIVLVTAVCGFLVGCCIKWLGAPGEIAAVVDNIHLQHGRIDIKQTPSMIMNSLVSITGGGSAGPEAPLVQIIGSFGSWLGERLGLSDDKVRIFTLCGMGTALGAFFGAPIGGAIFALEIPHKRGLEYYEALLPSCLGAVIGFLVFRSALGWHGSVYSIPTMPAIHYRDLIYAVILGIGGAGIGSLFAYLFSFTEKLAHPFSNRPIVLGLLGGIFIGLVAVFYPETLFWGEFQIQSLMTHTIGAIGMLHGVAPAKDAIAAHYFILAVVKMLAVGLTLHFGFRGGFIFPLFFIGAAFGLGFSLIVPAVPATVAVLTLMAAVNVAVTKTPVATTLILTALSSVNLVPVIAVASFTAVIVAARVEVIHSQRPREADAAA